MKILFLVSGNNYLVNIFEYKGCVIAGAAIIYGMHFLLLVFNSRYIHLGYLTLNCKYIRDEMFMSNRNDLIHSKIRTVEVGRELRIQRS